MGMKNIMWDHVMNNGICCFKKEILKKIQAFKFYGDLFILLDFYYIVSAEYLKIPLDRFLLIFFKFFATIELKSLQTLQLTAFVRNVPV